MKRSLFNAWLTALRSDKYKQAYGRLETENGFCCLGVLCKVAGKQIYLGRTGLDDVECKEFGMDVSGANLRSHDSELSLVNLNDDKKLSFIEIANVLEKDPSSYIQNFDDE